MDNFEKVEKLVEKAGVTYEEAAKALQEAGGDLLDAMILLERAGKAQGPEHSTWSTQYEYQTGYSSVRDAVIESSPEPKKGAWKEKTKDVLTRIWNVLSKNYLLVQRKGEEFVKLPIWLLLILLMASWGLILGLVIVSLFFSFTYRFVGENELGGANEMLDKASGAAEKVKEEFRNS